MVRKASAFALATASLGALALGVWGAAGADVPSTVVWTAYDVGSAGYNQSASIGHVMAEHEGVTVRVIPGGNDVARQAPLVAGRAHFGALGIAAFLSQEAVMEFASAEWGPQPTRILGAFWADFNTGNAACAADAGIDTVHDLEGKRIAWVVGAPALNLNMTSFLAGGGLTWDDVRREEFPSWGAAARAVVEDRADCFIASTNSGMVYELADSPRGYHAAHMPRPDDDPEAWERLLRVAPYWGYNEATIGAGAIAPDNPHIGATYGYPIITAYASQDEELVYQQTRMLYELFPHYKDAYPGNEGMALEAQHLDWVIPYHEGAIRYFEEQGVWSEELQAHNDELVRRQEALAEAWERALVEQAEQEVAAADFPELWMEIRAEALREGGFEPYWTERFW